MIKPIIKIKKFKFLDRRVIGIAIFPFIFLNKPYFDVNGHLLEQTINHEKIHIQQQKELLVIFFYLFYFLEFGVRLIFTNFDDAYKSISFEREAYDNEDNSEYLKDRKMFSFINYFKQN